MKRPTRQTFSIFGQIEEVVAEAMIKQYKLVRIAPKDIPAMVRFNENDELAKFAVVIPTNLLQEFEDRIAALRA